MKFDFDYAVKLFREKPAEFERYRFQVLLDYVTSLPPDKQRKLATLQAEIDAVRAELTEPEFMLWLTKEMHRKLNEMSAKMVDLNNKVSDNQIIRGYMSKP